MYDQLKRIADDVVRIRPDWDVTNVVNALAGVRDRGSIEALAAAAKRAAEDPFARTPAAITFQEHWAPKPKPRATVSYVAANPPPECANCRGPRRRSDRDGHPVPPPVECSACGAPWVDSYATPHGVVDPDAKPMPSYVREMVAEFARNFGKMPEDV